ncbi:midasin isoform X2 [Benincasa hispida]|uniref:midasin isoform X2 n=1 Tax=Benincasa hispida TaxID=102211 RepID=UPI001900CEC9|nr:midasin isoform X2 [Benincasa hispida]
MAIDGSFKLEFALERFLSRCPALTHHSPFDTLIKKGYAVTEEEVLSITAELFLNPNYSICLLGCFCPLAQKIVDRVIGLLRLVPNLRSNSDITDSEIHEEELDGVVNIISFYDHRGRGIDLHELACLAFCRALDLAPFLLGTILNYFKFAPCPFHRILVKGTSSEVYNKGGLLAVRLSYRFLLVEPETFTKLWDWSCFLDLMKLLSNIDQDHAGLLLLPDIRWCGIQILSILLKLGYEATISLLSGSEETLPCLLRWEEFCQDVSLEKAGSYVELFVKEWYSQGVNADFDSENCLLANSSFCGPAILLNHDEIERPKRSQRLATWGSPKAENSFVMTSSIKKGYEMVMLALSQKWPVLLYGPPGAGKSALIHKIASDSHNQVLFIHMDDQIDGKMLIGSYICAERPGEFRWQPGSLTQAVQNGLWVVFEDVDKAPSDVQSILLPLLEGGNTFSTGRGEEVRVSENFRLFATISAFRLDQLRNKEGGSTIGMLWRKVMIGPPNNEDLQSIVIIQYPILESIASKLVETLEKVNSYTQQFLGFRCEESASISYPNRFSLRDLLKWCKRIVGLGFGFMGDGFSAYQRQSIYQEAVDIFAAFSTSPENRLTIMKEIAKLWLGDASVPGTLYPQHKPAIQDSITNLRVGRVDIQRVQPTLKHKIQPFVEIRSSLHMLERIACSIKYNEPVLLVGETGTGKTTLVQSLARRIGHNFTVLNLSQQSDVADLLGGFKPIDAQFICFSLYKEFEDLFSKTFSLKVNGEFLAHLQKHFGDKNWKMLLAGFEKGVKFFKKSVEAGRASSDKKRKKPFVEDSIKGWEDFSVKLDAANVQIDASSGMVFSFVEGAFVTALRNGEWILLDEINLAPPETLQRVIGVLEGDTGSLCLAERGDITYISRHPNFRIFACMNPATDAGKRDLPVSLRSRFTEFFVDDVLDDEDLALFINQFMDDSQANRELVNRIVYFYKAVKKGSEERLQDGANQKPQYSLRSLYRALEYTRKAERRFGFLRALYDGFCMFFLTMLDHPSSQIVHQLILSHLLGGKLPPYISFDAYLSPKKDIHPDLSENYVLTKSVKEHLRNLARAVLIKRYPVLLQGPTSSGKTSLVKYLAALTGHEFVRINNHEHTDLQEYLGTYLTDSSGNLVFQEGMLVKAVRNGYWIVLDELNLAPSDVLEALNRLLDDNRELFVPELRETVQAHPDFMLFATQNPPTLYGGRKMLSRAFRNRFVEIHVDEIPEDELSTIVEKRCEIPQNYAKKMVDVMKELQLFRQSSKVFSGKHGFITPRDLFRWAYRFKEFGCSYEDLARDGYYLLAERLRDLDEKSVVRDVLERNLRVKLAIEDLYKQDPNGGEFSYRMSDGAVISRILPNITLTKSMQRLWFLVERCYKNGRNREPALLVGETGGGKTTICQLLSAHMKKKLHILNCHQYTETSDFIGGFYPNRERSKLTSQYEKEVHELISKISEYDLGISISSDIGQTSLTLDSLDRIMKILREGRENCQRLCVEELEHIKKKLAELHKQWQTIFTWQDGPLVQAMRDGDMFLIDEISLADDSVLERINSVLEPERKLALAEKGGEFLETVTAHPEFCLFATMNPGGDYGKKELSPALRNRFTEIWVPPVGELDELRSIALTRISNPGGKHLVDLMLNFWEWFNHLRSGRMITVRDLLSWVSFIDSTSRNLGPEYAFLHGAFLILLDGLSLGTGMSKRDAEELRKRCFTFLLEKLKLDNTMLECSKFARLQSYGWGELRTATDLSNTDYMQDSNLFGIDPFFIEKGCLPCDTGKYEFLAPTTYKNALRVLRAMQLSKPVLLEGSPGVGKTSLIVALGQFSGHRVVRINLSEQTDMMDLLGSDLPVESDEGIKFAWSDGILLQALKEGCWVLLDELNLAPQSVLEGLNAILDHRAEVFIPELALTFKCPPSFRVFACQNPTYQGGGRKGLPKSFLNRFTKVYLDELVEDDYLFICSSLYESIPKPLLSKLILFNKKLHEEVMLHKKFAQDGSPWEFNLRDVLRSCQIIEGAPERLRNYCFLNIVYVQRMRTAGDRRAVLQLYEQVFGAKYFINPYPRVQLNSRFLIVGNIAIERNSIQACNVASSQLKILPGIRQSLEAVAHCIQHQWMCILVGPSSSGKTSLIRLLAQLTGNVLNELNLSSTTDISELLGCFEQYDAIRNFHHVIDQVGYYVNKYCSVQIRHSMKQFDRDGNSIMTKWLSFSSKISFQLPTSSVCVYAKNWNRIVNSLGLLVDIIKQLMSYLQEVPANKELESCLKTVLKLVESNQRQPFSAKFEWVTGILVKAIERGEWIILKNANSCNPTVLDRINSLVESCGSITINECGTIDGEPVVLHPHANFRIFLTVNPIHGEVSRAMRNRGVEIFMLQPHWLQDEAQCGKKDILNDTRRFLALSGIPGAKLVESMANSHVYAREEGCHLNVRLTHIELARWVQLFQQLIMNGCKPWWSLHVSWEHTYLSSFGESEGMHIVQNAKRLYLSDACLSESDASIASLCLPGGWPRPITLIDYVWHSKEACVKQNCMYVEFLGAQCALRELGIAKGYSLDFNLSAGGYAQRYLVDWKKLHKLLFSKASNSMLLYSQVKNEFNLKLDNNKLFFAANWAIEQASEMDIELYIIWFSWFSSILQPFCQFFNFYLTSIKQVIEHPLWNFICHLRRKIKSLIGIDFDVHPIPILSSEFVAMMGEDDKSDELNASEGMLELPKDELQLSCTSLRNAIKCIGRLMLTYQQWNAESRHELSSEIRGFLPVLKSLRALEQEIFFKLIDPSYKLIESTSFDMLIESYSTLLDDHILLWDGLVSLNFELLQVSGRFLIKDILRFRDFFADAVEVILRETKKLEKTSWSFHSEKSLLWIHGGHPTLPSSADLYHKQQQLCRLCESLWQIKLKLHDRVPAVAGKDLLIEVFTSSNPELRCLAMEGLSMSSCILGKSDEDDVAQNLQDIYQMLLVRFKHEKNNAKAILESKDRPIQEEMTFICRPSGYDIFKKADPNVWLDTLPINDGTSFFLDMLLLQELSSILLLDRGSLKQALCGLSNLMKETLQFSLKFSSRPPQTFIAHQNMLWTLDECDSMDTVRAKAAGFFLEMWFRWHQSLWIHCPDFVKNFTKAVDYKTPVPHVLVQPVISATVSQILWHPTAIRDFFAKRLKIQIAACYLWHRPLGEVDAYSSLLSAACNLFQQIIYSHEKSFDADLFVEIKSLGLFYNDKTTEENIGLFCSLVAKSGQQRLKNSVHLFIEPLLKDLFAHDVTTDLHHKLGRVWLRLGGLRLYLLLSCSLLDPTIKYYYKYSQLMEKKSSLQVETEVRQECELLAGLFSIMGEADKERKQTFENLELECSKLQKKVVFRVEPGKFKKLKHECEEFFEFVDILLTNIEATDSHQIARLCNWEEVATCFIDRLSDEYTGYLDIIQPIQLAVYEMKLGLSLVLSSLYFTGVVEPYNGKQVMKSIYSFMRFPRGPPSNQMSVGLNNGLAGFSFHDLSADTDCFYAMDVGLLEKLVISSKETVDNDAACIMQLKSSLQYNILVRASHVVADSGLMDTSSFLLLDKIFNGFANLWMSMKVQLTTKEDVNSQLYKFKPRMFKIEKVIEADVDKSLDNENSSEMELLSEDEATEMSDTSKQYDTSEDEWASIDESMIDQMIHIHNQLFGSPGLVLAPGTFKVSDASRLHSFSGSYNLGLALIKDFGGLLLSSLDAKLAPEHLLRLCLEHEGYCVFPERVAGKYNFYKDPNPSMIANMVKLLDPLHQRVSSLLLDHEEHHVLQKILDIIEMLQKFSTDTPVAKALSGLQLLVNKVQTLPEHGSKFSSSEQLETILELVSSWKKMEFDSWPALLDEVQDQYELNCGKLWFPLFSILRHRHSYSTISSLEDFIHTSSVGEFRKRLELLFSFLGQIRTGFCVKVSSPLEMELVKALYNLFGYYVQFLPIILEHIEGCRKKIETELKEIQKLCRWERLESYCSLENSRRSRLKLRKLIKKYSDLLQQPVLLFFNQEAAKKGSKIQSLQSGAEDRFDWFTDWRKSVLSVLQNLYPNGTPESKLSFPSLKNLITVIQQSESQSQSLSYQEEWKSLSCTVERIYQRASYCDVIWKESKKSQGKRRALSELLKLLETSGLSRHKSIYLEENSKSWWFLQQSDDIQYLLLSQSRLSRGVSDDTPSSDVQEFQNLGLGAKRSDAIEYYFKSVKAVLLLQQTCLNSHKDVTREQVEQSCSFLNQLIVIQQKQHTITDHFAKHLNHLKSCLSLLEKLYSSSKDSSARNGYESRISCNQELVYRCLWQQKKIFDSLSIMAQEELILLKSFKNVHLKSCRSIESEENWIVEAIETFLPGFRKSKECLDNCLLGQKEVISTPASFLQPYVVTEQMKELIIQNFEVINIFREHHSDLSKRLANRRSIENILLGHFDEVFEKSSLVEEEFRSGLAAESSIRNGENFSEICSRFNEALQDIFGHIFSSLENFISSCSDHSLPEEKIGNVTSWEPLLGLCMKNLSLDTLCDKLLNTVSYADKLLYASGMKAKGNSLSEDRMLSLQVGTYFKQLHVLLDLIKNIGEHLLQDVLDFNCSVSVTTNVLATVLTNLYSEGFGLPTENPDNDVTDRKDQDVSGTGMGEGAGLNDVSDQMIDEDQLLGANEKASDLDAPTETPSKSDKGIEMEQDFDAETFSVSEDSEDDNEAEGDEQLESILGEAGAESEVVDEKMWNKEEDECLINENEKVGSGPPVENEDVGSCELRANDELSASADESCETDINEQKESNGEGENDSDPSDGEEHENMNFDHEQEVAEPSELKHEESNECSDLEMDEKEDASSVQDNLDEDENSTENGNIEENVTDPIHENMTEAETERETSEMDIEGGDREENNQLNAMAPRNDASDAGENVQNAESATQPNGGLQSSDSRKIDLEKSSSRSNEIQNDGASSRSMPSGDASETDILAADSSSGGRFTDDPLITQLPQPEASSFQKMQPNPYRNVGDALNTWKERARVSVDLQANNEDVPDEMEDQDAEEYGFVSELEKGSAQAMGPATSEQIDTDANGNNFDKDSTAALKSDISEPMESERQNLETRDSSRASIHKSVADHPLPVSNLNNLTEEESQEHRHTEDGDSTPISDNLVSVNRTYLNEPMRKFEKLSVSDDELGKVNNTEVVSSEVKDNATVLWRKYELRTTRLSQELAEQLRLVMEPTLASKLQGDYKTGKRINMKKVIPYIASHYRKDKIWMRRTRPNKRDYQIVIAVDDSQSMSESCCGDIAIEALVTVCRAMSQLEMGSLAVASFGKKGNIRLLHDFDQSFTAEAGVQMISNLTFKQENSITDEPVVDLLKYLNDTMDNAATKARLPSGYNPLQQLVLIIADGRFHEKDKLKRYVRDLLSRKRMVAFLLLDSPQESIMELMEASFDGGNIKFSKYLDSFPFPYYIILRNIEALPRTLGDLLRQWFELMQNAGD